MAQRDGLRVLLRVHGWRDQSVAALSLPGSYPDLSVARASRLQPDYRYGRRGDQVYDGIECRRAGEAFFPLLCARWYARAASPNSGMDQEDQRYASVRQRVERPA